MQRPVVYRCLIVAWLILSLPSTVLGNVVEQVIVAVNGEPYTLSNLREYARKKIGREFPHGDLNRIGKEDKEVLEQFITEKLLAAEVRLVGINVSDPEIDEYIETIKQKNNLTDQDLRAALSREGVTLEGYRESVRAEIEKNEIINRQVRKRVNITSDDVERYYRLNSKKYMAEEKVRLRHILLSLPQAISPEREREMMLRTLEIRKRAIASDDFAKLAQSYSDGSGASEGGDIGWVTRGSLIREIEEIAFNKLSVGEVSQPLRTSLGIHLIKLEGREVPRPLPLHEVHGRIKEELYAKALEERFQRWLKTDLRRTHRVDVKLPGVVFRPEDTKEGTVDSLMASRSRRSRQQDSSFLSYLNPLSYIFAKTPVEDDEAGQSDRQVISVLGVPLFTTQAADEGVEDPLSIPPASEPPAKKTEQAGGFFSSIWKALNPFSSNNP